MLKNTEHTKSNDLSMSKNLSLPKFYKTPAVLTDDHMLDSK